MQTATRTELANAFRNLANLTPVGRALSQGNTLRACDLVNNQGIAPSQAEITAFRGFTEDSNIDHELGQITLQALERGLG